MIIFVKIHPSQSYLVGFGGEQSIPLAEAWHLPRFSVLVSIRVDKTQVIHAMIGVGPVFNIVNKKEITGPCIGFVNKLLILQT